MTFIPNEGSAPLDGEQAELDSVDLNIILDGFRLRGVKSGCTVSASVVPAMTAEVAAGVISFDTGVDVTVGGGTVTFAASDSTIRFDLVVADSSGALSVISGAGVWTVLYGPVFPTYTDKVVLAVVEIATDTTAVNTANIVDKRIFINFPTTTAIAEGTNLYHTSERVMDVVGALLADSTTINVTYNDAGDSLTIDVIPGGIDHGGLAGLADDDHTQYTRKDTLTTIGDIYYASAISTPARLGAVVPVANVRNVLGLDNGDTIPAWKTALDGTTPVTISIGSAGAPGTSLVFAHRDHDHPAPLTWTATAHALLGTTTHSDVVTLGGVPVRGDIMFGNSTPKWDRLPVGVAGSLLQADGTDTAWTINPLVAGYAAIGTTSAPAHTTAGDLTAIRGFTLGDHFFSNSNLTTQDQFFLGRNSVTQPSINFDSGDFQYYDRTANTYNWDIGNTDIARIDALGHRITGYLSLHGTGTSPAVTTAGYLFAPFYVIGQNQAPISGTAFLTQPEDLAPSAQDGTGAQFSYDRSAGAGGLGGLVTLASDVFDSTSSGMQSGKMVAFQGKVSKLGASTSTVLRSVEVTARIDAGTATSINLVDASGNTYIGGAVTTMRGFNIANLGNAIVGTAVGIDIEAQSGAAANFGIRNAGNSVQTGYARFGGVTAPLNITAGDITGVRLTIGTDSTRGATTGYFANISGTLTDTSAGAKVGLAIGLTADSASASSSEFRNFYLQTIIPASNTSDFSGYLQGVVAEGARPRSGVNITGQLIGVSGVGMVIESSTTDAGVISSAVGVQGQAISRGSGSFVTKKLTLGRDFLAANPASLSGFVVDTLIGLDIEALSVGTVNIGIRNSEGKYDFATIALPANPASGLVRQWALTAATGVLGGAVRFLDASGHDSGVTSRARNIVPTPLGFPTGLTNQTPTTTQGRVGMVTIPAPIMLHSIAFILTTASAGANGRVRLAVWNEAGTLITQTLSGAGTVLPVGANELALATDVYLPAGTYYVGICRGINYATTNPIFSCLTTNNSFQAVTGHEVLCGTIVCTTGLIPDPIGTITSADNSTPYFKFYGTVL